MLDYDLLRILWWLLLGVLLIGFALTDGFDLGVATLLPFIGKTDREKRIMINAIGPVWESNQVWLILGGGAIFAAWPMVYAVAFSGFYLAMLVVLLALILRPVAFKFRSKQDHIHWRHTWDAILFISGFVPALIFGVALGNVVQGVPFYFDSQMRIFYTGSFWGLLNPYALLAGVTSVAMTLMHGSLYLAIKTDDPISHRARCVAQYAAPITLVLCLLNMFLLSFWMKAYLLDSPVAANAMSIPLNKQVSQAFGWSHNFLEQPLFLIAPIALVLGGVSTIALIQRSLKLAFVSSGVFISGIIATVGFSIYPFILPSSSQPNHSLLIWDASSSQLTLFLMLLATLFFMPIVLAYITWVYRVLRGKVSPESIDKEINSY